MKRNAKIAGEKMAKKIGTGKKKGVGKKAVQKKAGKKDEECCKKASDECPVTAIAAE